MTPDNLKPMTAPPRFAAIVAEAFRMGARDAGIPEDRLPPPEMLHGIADRLFQTKDANDMPFIPVIAYYEGLANGAMAGCPQHDNTPDHAMEHATQALAATIQKLVGHCGGTSYTAAVYDDGSQQDLPPNEIAQRFHPN